MSDRLEGPPEADPVVNPYSLLEAVNETSDDVHVGWLLFLAIMAYMMIAIAGVTHKALLLDSPVELPILQVRIPLTEFFQFAPVILMLFHLGLVAQLALLARKTLELDAALRLLETTDRRTHPLRLELHNFFFVQAIAGPHRSVVMSAFLHTMSWLTLVILPVTLILYTQVVFLPYHSIPITWTHRVVLLADLAVLIVIGVFLTRLETSFSHAFWRHLLAQPASFLATAVLLSIAALFSFFVATIPDEAMDRLTRSFIPGASAGSGAERRSTGSYALPGLLARADGSILGIFRRNLEVTDTDLVVDKDVSPGEASLNLRGRDLRFARLDRSDLHQADFTSARLDDASFVGADLRGISLQCKDTSLLLLSDDRATADCPSARRAVFTRANLSEARMNGADLAFGRFDDANLEAAELAHSVLTAATFTAARLDRADLGGGVSAEGADFIAANLTGADLTGAQLTGADFRSAVLQGAVLSHAHLEGARLSDADLEAAAFSYATLYGADMTGARIAVADLHGAHVWLARPPTTDTSGLADLSELDLRAIDEGGATAIRRSLDRLTPRPALASLVRDMVQPLLATSDAGRWSTSGDLARWQAMMATSQTALAGNSRQRLADALTRLVCRPRNNALALATGIARRAQSPHFKGDPVAVYDRMRAEDCSAGKALSPKVAKDLATVAEQARGD